MAAKRPAAARPATAKVSLSQARAFWQARQGLDEPKKSSLEEAVASTGWLRTLGGVDVYLAMRARVPSMKQSDLEDAVEKSRLQVVPAVRGCIYLVPRAQVPLVMRVAEDSSLKRMERDLAKAGSSLKESEELMKPVLKVLSKGPLTTDAIRRALPEGSVRSLGDKGKKVGVSSPLPSTLRLLEFAGKIERSLEGGRLDTERYAWRVPAKNVFDGVKVPKDPEDRVAELARIFFAHAGPATLEDFAGWAAISQRDARAATSRISLLPVEVADYAEEAWVLEEDLKALETAKVSPRAVMISMEDNYLTFHGGPRSLVDPQHYELETPLWGSGSDHTLGGAKHIMMRSLVRGGKLIGFWEIDPDKKQIVWATFDKLPAKDAKTIDREAEDVLALLVAIGHAKAFSLDTTESIKDRLKRVRAMR
jgi:hypothetical protein